MIIVTFYYFLLVIVPLTNVDEFGNIISLTYVDENEVMNMQAKEETDISRLPDAELDVMLVLWHAKQPLKTAKILELLNKRKDWSISTLQSLLARLEERGFVKVQKQMRFKYYLPVISEEDYRRKETRTFLERLHHNSFKSLIATLIDTEAIDASELEEIEEMLRKAGSKND